MRNENRPFSRRYCLVLLILGSGISGFVQATDESAPSANSPAKPAPVVADTVKADSSLETKPSNSETTASGPKEDTKKEPVFTGEALQLKNLMLDLFAASQKVNSTEAAAKSEARRKIDQALDWDRIAETCLGKDNWKRQSSSNRTAFKNLLQDVVERTAFSRLDKFWKGSVFHFEKITVTGNDAHLPVKFKASGESMKLDYYFHRKGKKWLMDDVAYNNMRYSVNINDQIDAFLREKGFSQLLQKLRKRRDELVADSSDARRR